MPGGQGLEAVGSYDGSRARGLRVVPLKQIKQALQKKMEKMGQKEQPRE